MQDQVTMVPGSTRTRRSHGIRQGLWAVLLLGLLQTSMAIATPTVTMTAPTDGATQAAPATFALAANATGAVVVRFIQNGTLIIKDTSAPYTATFATSTPGTYSLTALAFDGAGNEATSSPITVTVTGATNVPPTVSLTSPSNGATAVTPASFTLTASASDSDGTISSVAFYSGSTLLATGTSAPYTTTFTTSTPGTYSLTAVATDNSGASTTSSPISVTATAPTDVPPTVSLTSPSNGGTAVAPASLVLTASASDSDGTISNVAFYSGTTLLATATSAPYTWTYASVPAGSYAFTAKATDNAGLVTTSSAVNVTVTTTTQTTSLTRSYVYDANQRLCKRIEPESGATLMAYDGAGNIAWTVTGSTLTSLTCDRTSVPAADMTLRSYDALNRPLLVDVPNTSNDLQYSYFADGALQTLTSGANTWTYSYNQRRLPVTEQLSIDGRLSTITHTYNALGQQSSLTYPSGLVVATNPNALGQPTQAGTYATGISYYANGGMSGFSYGNGIVHTLTQNARFLPQRSLDIKPGSAAVLDDTYSYDANANVASITDGTTGNGGNRTMLYDGLDRLTSTYAPHLWWINATTNYDALDNILSNTVGNRTYNYAYDATSRRLSQLTRPDNSVAYTLGYDAFGNVTSKGSGQDSYAFDAANRMTGVTGKESYSYDGYGRRVKITRLSDNKLDYPIYTMGGQLLSDEDQRSNKSTDYIDLNGSLLAKRSTPIGTNTWTTTYEHTDALHSPIAETDSAGNFTRIELYTPYGEPNDNAYVQGPGYTGHVTDAATGLTYAQQRYYDPIIGRFLSVDPVGANDSGGNFNRYWYANNNPYKFTDPDGRCASGLCMEQNSDQCKLNPMCANSLSTEAQSKPVSDNGKSNTGNPSSPTTTAAPPPKELGTITVIGVRPVPLPSIPWGAMGEGALDLLGRLWAPIALIWPSRMDAPACEMPGHAACGMMMSSKFPRGYMPGPAGAREWGRRNDVDPEEAARRFHRGVKGNTPGAKADHDYGVHPGTGDVVDPNGESAGNLEDEHD